MREEDLKIQVSNKLISVSGKLIIPEGIKALLVFAHGAGAPMSHPFMNKIAEYLSDRLVGTLRYNFPYSEKKQKRIDSLPLLHDTVHSAVLKAREIIGNIPLFAGGKSMGGRMTSQAAAEGLLEGLKGIIFFGFPLHAPGKESVERAEHLYLVRQPMLFIQGTRDKLANLELLKPVISKIGSNAKLQIINGADHSFHVLKSSPLTDDEVLGIIATHTSEWIDNILS